MTSDHIYISSPLNSPVGTLGIGVFDGLHKGHQVLLEKCDALLSFNPHPDIVLHKSPTLKLLSTPEELQAITPKIGFLTFTKEIASLSPDAFLDTVILKRLSPKAIVVGFDFRFGYKQQGSPEFLKDWGGKHGIQVDVIPAVEDGEGSIKSERIRHAFKEGKFDLALALLGHPYWIIGNVIQGEGRGRNLGFPTANLQLPDQKLIPNPGVYSGSAKVDGSWKPAMVYIGRKPTFSGESVGVEVHIPEFSGSLYGQPLTVTLTHFIRPEQKFKDKDALVAQILLDIDASKKYHTF